MNVQKLLSTEDELHTLSLTLNDHTTSTGPIIQAPWRDRHRHDIVKFHLSNISCCKRADSNTHKSKKPCLPPNFRHSNEIFKLIKVRNIFISFERKENPFSIRINKENYFISMIMIIQHV